MHVLNFMQYVYMQALERQLKKKGLCDFSMVYTLFAFASQVEAALRIYAPKDHDKLVMVAMEPESGEVK